MLAEPGFDRARHRAIEAKISLNFILEKEIKTPLREVYNTAISKSAISFTLPWMPPPSTCDTLRVISHEWLTYQCNNRVTDNVLQDFR